MSTLKKIFFLCLIVFLMSLLIWGVYNISFRKNAPEEASSEPQNSTVQKNDSSAISVVINEAVLAPTLSKDTSHLQYFSQKDGLLYRAGLDGSAPQTLSTKSFWGLIDAAWSPDKTTVVTKVSGSKGEALFLYFNPGKDEKIPLKSNLDEVVWETGANRIFYKYYSPDTQERSLNVADPNGANWKKLADLDYKNLSIAQIPKTGLVSFWNSGDAFSLTSFSTVPIIGGDQKILFKEKYGADYLWNASGSNVLVSHTDARGGSNMQLAVMNYSGGEYKNLNVPTFSSKCVWSRDGKTVYYALPGNIPGGAILPNDYKNGNFNTADTFWKVNIQTGEKTRIVETKDIKEKYDASQMFLNEDESLLFFVNKIDTKLYRIKL